MAIAGLPLLPILVAKAMSHVSGYLEGHVDINVLDSTIVGWLVVLSASRWATRRSWVHMLRVRWVPVRVVAAAVIAGVGLALALGLLVQFLPGPSRPGAPPLEDPLAPAFVLATACIGPYAEEVFFRGVVLRSLLARLSVTGAIVLSAFLFGLGHQDVQGAVYAFPMGLLFGWVALRTRSLMPSIAGHVFANALYLPLFLVPHPVLASQTGWIACVAIGCAMAVAGIGLIALQSKGCRVVEPMGH